MSTFVYDVQQVSQLYKKGKTRILANEQITMNIREGEIVGVLGPNGAGKSTLIKQLVGHLKPTKGKVLFFGQDVQKHTRTVAGLVAYFAQNRMCCLRCESWMLSYLRGSYGACRYRNRNGRRTSCLNALRCPILVIS